jgi:magnesium transporter
MDVWSYKGGAWQRGDLEGADLRWFDVVGPENRALEELAARFGLHPLAIEDCLSLLPHAPKIDEFHDHLFIVLQAFVQGDAGPATEEIDVFLGKDFVITYRDEPLPTDGLVQDAMAAGQTLRAGADGLFYEFTDRAVDSFLPVVHRLAERLDALQEDIIRNPNRRGWNDEILAIRAASGRLRRLLMPQLGVFQRLGRGEFAYISDANRMYIRDIYDHLVRLDLSLEGLREDAEVALSSYLGALNNRMNEVMKVLAIVAALALPATVVTGVFGTNFDDIPGLHSNWGFAAMIAGILTMSTTMMVFFRRRGWF